MPQETAHNSSRLANILITGGYGCIGAEAAKWLLRHTDAQVVIASREVNDERNRKVFGDAPPDRLVFVQVDVTSQERLEELLSAHEISHVAHLAGLQTPDCNAHRDLGLQVNLAGTQNIIEAMKATERQFERFVFASSVAVYGPRAHYPSGQVPMLSEPLPVNVYGAWKLAGEQITRLFASETKTPSISVRPGALFGPGRDAGLTATPTTAIKHVAQGLPYEIPYRSKQDYLYAPDVGAAVGHTLVDPFEGYGEYTLPSHTVDTQQFVAAIENAAKSLNMADKCQVTVGADEVPFICELDFAPFLAAFPQAPHTPFQDAITQSLATFVEQYK